MTCEWPSVTHHFSIGDLDGYAIASFVPCTGDLVAVRVVLGGKSGDTLRAMVESLFDSISLGLSHGVPLAAYRALLLGASFDPSGATKNPAISLARSIPDYVFRWLDLKFPDGKIPVAPKCEIG